MATATATRTTEDRPTRDCKRCGEVFFNFEPGDLFCGDCEHEAEIAGFSSPADDMGERAQGATTTATTYRPHEDNDYDASDFTPEGYHVDHAADAGIYGAMVQLGICEGPERSLFATDPGETEQGDPGPTSDELNRCMGCGGPAKWTGTTYDDCDDCQWTAYLERMCD